MGISWCDGVPAMALSAVVQGQLRGTVWQGVSADGEGSALEWGVPSCQGVINPHH